MDNRENLFSEFAPISRQNWMEKVAKELKGRPLDDINWAVEEGIEISPYFSAEEQKQKNIQPLKAVANTWTIAAHFSWTTALKTLNQQLLKELNNGLELLCFQMTANSVLSPASFKQLLAGVELKFIRIHFALSGFPPEKLLKHWLDYLKDRYEDWSDIRFSLHAAPDQYQNPEFLALLQTVLAHHQHFRISLAPPSLHRAQRQTASAELLVLLTQSRDLLNFLTKQGLSPDRAASLLQLELTIGTSYFVEIAKLRALQILWANLTAAYGLSTVQLAPLSAHLALSSQTEDIHVNMIRATSQAMSAVLGGVDVLYLRPADAATQSEPGEFTRRVARNIHHLLKMESHLDRVVDPAAGSYYIEELTRQLALKTWQAFQN
ncbi:MAG: methylmalonyl-CoA mutase family protein [Bacteroidota bacterium]